MAMPLHVLTTEAMALDPGDRLQLARELIDSVGDPLGPPDSGWADAWTAEVERRVQEADQAGVRGRDWNEVRQDILERLASR